MTARKIMVVDDEPAIGRLLSYQLGGFGYDVCYVQDGLQALEHVLIERPDLILLDVMMPLVSGWDVCREIRGSSAVPIIMLTGKNADTDVVAGLEAGADDYVTKPFSIAQLHARIEAVLRRTSARPEGRSGRADDRRAERDGWSAAQELPGAARRSAPPPVPEPVHLAEAAPAPRTAPAPRPQAERPPQPRRLGQRAREARQRRGLTLYQAERDCRVRWEFLQAIEQENWSYLPSHQLRPAVLAYTGFLGIDPGDVAGGLPSERRPLHIPAALALALVLLIVVGLTLL